MIVENYGDSVFNIKNEIDKLCILIDSEKISSDDFSTSIFGVGVDKDGNYCTSIGKRDLEKSIKAF